MTSLAEALAHDWITTVNDSLIARDSSLRLSHRLTAKGGSTYCTFSDPRMGQLRIGDHKERERYGYRWQIRTDLEVASETRGKGHRQFFFPFHWTEELAKALANYHQAIITRGGPL